MTASILPSLSSHAQVKVNVRLCGSIPRVALSMMQHEAPGNPQSVKSLPVFPTSLADRTNVPDKSEKSIAKQLCSELNFVQERGNQVSEPKAQQAQHNFFPGTLTSSLRRPPPTYEAPSWAVPARGETRLEPVCDSVDRQAPVDLTSRAVFRVGRSPQSDVQLLHVTSSRRHAMIFHHSNGSCYLVDCGSAHGTYINGVRVVSTPNDSNVVVPTRIRRGSIVRFGGPGAPSYMLKSFSFDLEEMKDCPVPTINTTPAKLPPTPVLKAMVEHNTRLNSLGRTAKQDLLVHRQISSKRSFDSMETVLESDDELEHHSGPIRLSSPPMSPEQSPLRLVSPELNCVEPSSSSFKRRRVTFSDQTLSSTYPILVSPDVSSDEQE